MTRFQSAQSGFSNRRTLSPGALGAAVAVHVIAAGVVIALPPAFVPFERVTDLVVRNIPLAPTPKPPEPSPKEKPTEPTKIRTAQRAPEVKPVFIETILPTRGVEIDAKPPRFDPPPMPRLDEGVTLRSRPVLVGAVPDPRFADSFQPAYPAAKLRLGEEGSCTLSVAIDIRGRVTRAQPLSSGDSAFCDAAERQALTKWRFRPATEGGAAVASEKTMTVHFRMTD